MTIHLVTLSDESMSRSRELCADSAMRRGISLSTAWTWDAFKALSMADHEVFRKARGLGMWAWKPAIIDSTLHNPLPNVTHVVYADAGIEFINNVHHIIDRMDQDIFLFGNNWEHAHWCKRDVVEAIWPATQKDLRSLSQDLSPNATWLRFGKQVQASVIFFRVSDYSRAFVKEWLDWCLFEGGRLIDDSPSRTPNHPEFREHRHDQAILTTMAYRDGLKLHYWPAMYNDGAFTYEKLPEYAGDDYPVLFHHHRRRNHEWGQVA